MYAIPLEHGRLAARFLLESENDLCDQFRDSMQHTTMNEENLTPLMDRWLGEHSWDDMPANRRIVSACFNGSVKIRIVRVLFTHIAII